VHGTSRRFSLRSIAVGDRAHGIAHIGIYAERETASADLKRNHNLEVATNFRAQSKLIDVYLHMPQVWETISWTIAETDYPGSRLASALLDDPRLVCFADSDVDTDVAAWHLSPLVTPTGRKTNTFPKRETASAKASTPSRSIINRRPSEV
jgi:hypothetical protein